MKFQADRLVSDLHTRWEVCLLKPLSDAFQVSEEVHLLLANLKDPMVLNALRSAALLPGGM